MKNQPNQLSNMFATVHYPDKAMRKLLGNERDQAAGLNAEVDTDDDDLFRTPTAEERAHMEANEAWFNDDEAQKRMRAEAVAVTGMHVDMAVRADMKVSGGIEAPSDRMPPQAFRAAHLAAVVEEMRIMEARQKAYQTRKKKAQEVKERVERRRQAAKEKRGARQQALLPDTP